MALQSTQKELEGKVHEITLLTNVKQDLNKFIDDLYEKLKNQETAISLEMVNTLKAKLN
jgi:predicted RND superfamily exporter protein